jgi:hypothetical protein
MNHGLGARDDRFAARGVLEDSESPGGNIRGLLFLALYGVYSKPWTRTGQ